MFFVFFALPVIIPLPNVKAHPAKSAMLGRIIIVMQHNLRLDYDAATLEQKREITTRHSQEREREGERERERVIGVAGAQTHIYNACGKLNPPGTDSACRRWSSTTPHMGISHFGVAML